MSAERGWIGEPQPARQWHDSHFSREAEKIAARQAREMPDMEELTGLEGRSRCRVDDRNAMDGGR